jgi:serine/threonine-protein kinase RsbW
MGVARANHRSRTGAAAAARGKNTPKSRGKKLQFTIASNLAAGRDVLLQILSEIEKHRYSEGAIFGIRLALEEALVNAIKHGNKLDPDKKVQVEASIGPRELCFVIEDQGPGFNRGGVPDPRLEQNIERCCGRGLLLMESYMDRVEYSLGGRRVRLVKKNRGHEDVKT